MPDPRQPIRPLSVWATGQQHPRRQRAHRYSPASTAHPAKMLPALARHIIATFTRPGDLILDPMCGIGTSCVEAAHLARHAIGVEYEPRWATIARANAALAAGQGAPGTIRIITADARGLPAIAPADAAGTVALVLTSPPYGKATHGQVHADRSRGVHKRDFQYGHGAGNLARHLARHAGLVRADRAVALLAGLRGTRLIPRTTFFALHNARAARDAGIPLHVVAHEDVLLLRRLDGSGPGRRAT
ncbi:TRM11 family methyltransferase [Frankia sp. CiP3]|uniref:TRM11 family SAM-dependent methyltransferase n=1 Tax=Frankia sp. CiP3 TaxID=2880971 RepID=UPI001EF6236F|nr:DNA methyltransferase [Frankia sp. CiP3]